MRFTPFAMLGESSAITNFSFTNAISGTFTSGSDTYGYVKFTGSGELNISNGKINNAAFCTFMPMLLVMIAVNRIGSGLTAQAGMLGPIATIFLGWYFLGESITVVQVVGMSIVLAGVAILATMQTQKNQPRPELAEAE